MSKRFELKVRVITPTNQGVVKVGVHESHIVGFHEVRAWLDDVKYKLNIKSGRGMRYATDFGITNSESPSFNEISSAIACYFSQRNTTAEIKLLEDNDLEPKTEPKSEPKTEPNPEPTEPKTEPTEPKKRFDPKAVATSSASGGAADALTALFGGIKTEILDDVLTAIEPYINNIQQVEHNITLPDGSKNKMEGVLHAKFDKILKMVCAGINVYLFGDAGTGKSKIAEQIAKAMNLPYYQQDKVESMYEFIGTMDAHGRFHETPIFRAWTGGGICCLDEFDGYLPSAVLKFNGGLSQGVMVFGDGKAYTKHPDCHIIATGNTNCQGADKGYITRFPQDVAATNRFCKVKIDYDRNIELSCAQGDVDLVDFAHQVRNYAKSKQWDFVMSYRNIFDMVTLDNVLSTEDAIMSRIVYDLDEDSARILLRALPEYDNKWFKAAKKIAKSL